MFDAKLIKYMPPQHSILLTKVSTCLQRVCIMSLLNELHLYDCVDYEFNTTIKDISKFNSFYTYTTHDSDQNIRIGAALFDWVNKSLHVPMRYDKNKHIYDIDIKYTDKISRNTYVYSDENITDEIISIVVIADMTIHNFQDVPVIIIESTHLGMYTHVLNMYAHPICHFQKGLTGYGRFLGQGLLPYLSTYNPNKTKDVLFWIRNVKCK